MIFIKHEELKIPYDFNAKAAGDFEDELDVSYIDVIQGKRIKHMVYMAWYGIQEGYRQQKKKCEITIDDLWKSNMTDPDSLLFKVISAQEEAEKK